MRIGLNLHQLDPGRIGGLENYLRELVRDWTERDGVRAVLFGTPIALASFEDRPRLHKIALEPAQLAALDAAELARHGVEAWFCPLLVLEPRDPGLPCAATIPDLQHERHPEFFTPELLDWRRREYARTVRSADAIFTLSEFSRRMIIETLGASADRVHATHLDAGAVFARPPSETRVREVLDRHALSPGYLYYPANNWPHKNHVLLFEALALYGARQGRCPVLVLTGSDLPTGVDLLEAAAARGLEDRVHRLGRVPAAEVPALYRGAAALVVPSLFEGFGIPLVEAMRMDCPIVCARATSLPEVAGEAAAYFDPEDAETLRAALGEVLGSSALREELRSRGRARQRLFSWERTAKRTLDVLRETVRGRAAPRLEVREPPLVSVVTPSFEQAGFIRETLESVLAQDYPRIEHVVVDGGSTDGTLEILREVQSGNPERLRWASEPDRGQSDAVNKGVGKSRGEIIGWLNSDDVYEPGAIRKVVEAFSRAPRSGMLYGRAQYVDEEGHDLGPYPVMAPFDWHLLAHNCYICQPAAFLRRSTLDRIGGLDPTLQYCMDYDLWIRLGRSTDVTFLDERLARSRLHRENKTLGSRRQVFREIIATAKRHYGYVSLAWAYGYMDYLVNGVDQILERRPQGWRVKALTALFYLQQNATRPALVWRDLQHLRRALRAREAG